MKMKITFNILSYWHAGSGFGRGADLDALVVKDTNGLSYLPGRTVKGLFREALETLEENGLADTGSVAKFFGKKAEEGLNTGSTQGLMSFSDATLEQNEILKISCDAELKEALFDRLSSTALDSNGTAVNHSLRAIELCLPVSLYAFADITQDEKVANNLLEACCNLIRSVGSHRNRGLGRCSVSIQKAGEAE